MEKDKTIRYEKPMLAVYRFAVTVAVGVSPSDIDEGCDSEFDA